MRIDLHAHSTASDGTDSPGALMEVADAAGLDVVAITDHDTTAGWEAASAALPPAGHWCAVPSCPAGGTVPSRRWDCTCWPTCSTPATGR